MFLCKKKKAMLPLYAAPLQGFTEAPWRNAHQELFGGVDAYYTPFVRIEKGAIRPKDLRDIAKEGNTVPRLVPQLIASAPAELARLVEQFAGEGYDEADINLGCPFPLITAKHKGSGILPYPEEVAALLHELSHYPNMRFSVKLRLGWAHADEWRPLMPLLNAAPLQQVTLHPRIGRQQYKGEADRIAFAAFYEACRHPLVYNGDVLHAADIRRLESEFPRLAGVMLGRGLLARPSLAWEYVHDRVLSETELHAKVKAFHDRLLHAYEKRLQGDTHLLNKMKPYWDYLLPDMDKKWKKAIKKANSLNHYLLIVSQL